MRLAWTLAVLLAAPLVRADEGMWPFNMIPKAQIKKDHGVDLTDAWLDHVRLSSVRFNSGGSGSFVSPKGLVLTNHHVAGDCINKLGASDHDYMATGYVAGKDGPEIKCPDLELNVTVGMEEVTDRVRAARKPGMSDADANVAIKGAMSQIEKECTEKTGNRCDVVTLYAGGRYDLYTYKKYTDVRLVFAPEFSIAFFGGDPENFTYPRFDLDMALFRIYDKGQPVQPKDYLKWSETGPKEGDPVFVSGHPGATSRMQTVSQLAVTRDVTYPYVLDHLGRERTLLLAFGKEGTEPAREIREHIFGIENSIKALSGMRAGLLNAALMAKKEADETALKKAIAEDPKLKEKYGTVFDEVAAVQKKLREMYKRYAALEGRASGSALLAHARDLVRLPAELALPNDKRLREYRESNLDSLKLGLLSPAPVYGGVEVPLVRAWLERLERDLGAKDPLVAAVLAGRTPERAAREIVVGSKLSDVYARRAVLDGGKGAVDASTDPAVVTMRAIDAEARAARKRYEDEVEAPMRLLGEKVAQAVFAIKGASVPPDATFTLRLSIGTLKGYTEKGKAVAWDTTMGGLYAHATGKDPLKLPQRWLDAKSALKPDVPLNFVSTNDIIGGNSGSPLVNAAGELVGLIFDGNLSSLPNRFVYGETTQRAVSVDSAGMIEAMKKVYGAEGLVREMLGK
jgi:hypothetical protein